MEREKKREVERRERNTKNTNNNSNNINNKSSNSERDQRILLVIVDRFDRVPAAMRYILCFAIHITYIHTVCMHSSYQSQMQFALQQAAQATNQAMELFQNPFSMPFLFCFYSFKHTGLLFYLLSPLAFNSTAFFCCCLISFGDVVLALFFSACVILAGITE